MFFENSIVCRCTIFCVDLVSARSFWLLFYQPFWCARPFTLSGWVHRFFSDNECQADRCCGWFVVCFFAGFGLFTELAFVESLILAQDERWRRA